MRKKELLSISPKAPTEEMIAEAVNDRYEKRTYRPRYYYKDSYYTAKSYSTRVFPTVKREGNILVVAFYIRADLAAGRIEPRLTTYISTEEEKWLSYIAGKWSEAYTRNLFWDVRDLIKKTEWDYAHDVQDSGDIVICNEALDTDEDAVLKSVTVWQESIREEANRSRAKRRADYWERQMAKIPELPEDFDDWIMDEATRDQNFLLYRKKGKQTEVYCTYCEHTYTTPAKMVHNPGDPLRYDYKPEYKYVCQHCRTLLAAKAWRRQKYLTTKERVAIMQPAEEYIAFRSFDVVKRFRLEDDFPKESKWKGSATVCETTRILANRYSFESIESYIKRDVPFLKKVTWSTTIEQAYKDGTIRSCPWRLGTAIPYTRNLESALENTGVRPIVAKMFLKEEETSLQYALERAAEKRYVEYLVKAGLSRMARTVVSSYGSIVKDENAKNLKDLLGLDGQQINIMKRLNGNPYTIKILQYLKKHEEKLDEKTIEYMTDTKIDPGSLNLGRTGMTMQRMVNYIRKQAEKNKKSFESTNLMYSDYLNMAYGRGMDLTDEIVCHTSKLKELHDRYLEEENARKMKLARMSADKKFPQIAARYSENAEHFAYKRDGLMIMVPHCAEEIREEGRQQHHCVGANDNYMRKMNEGTSYILFLRKQETPDVPYYTLEVDYDGHVRQSYGAYDRKPDWKDVEPVLTGFTRQIQKRTKKEKQERIMVPAV